MCMSHVSCIRDLRYIASHGLLVIDSEKGTSIYTHDMCSIYDIYSISIHDIYSV